MYHAIGSLSDFDPFWPEHSVETRRAIMAWSDVGLVWPVSVVVRAADVEA